MSEIYRLTVGCAEAMKGYLGLIRWEITHYFNHFGYQ
jgi:hypothetical protein